MPLFVIAIGLAVLSSSWLTPVFVREAEFEPIQSMADPRLAALARAVPIWNQRLQPTRRVADIVCLVPDRAAFYEALAFWDEHTFFPILIDEPESTLRFLRAFRPRRVVIWTGPRAFVDERDSWSAAVWAVARSATSSSSPNSDEVHKLLNDSRTPGLVLSAPSSPSLAGAVALAAGRRQTLLRVEFDRSSRQTLNLPQAVGLANELEQLVRRERPRYSGLGDDCDFLTLGCDWPDRYSVDQDAEHRDRALDDLLGRNVHTGARYAYVGRLVGTTSQALYQAMCSLFLQPRAALLFDGYSGRGRPWSDYEMKRAARELGTRLTSVVCVQSAESAGIGGWRKAFSPRNRYGLILVNSSGTPTEFNLAGSSGATQDVPLGEPAAIYMIHSLSAARPDDSGTIAGRWLANGAFLYFGSLEEPYLAAFRTPGLAAQLLAAGTPVSAALAKLPEEDPMGAPWRLRLLGDPIYRLDGSTDLPRVPGEELSGTWKDLSVAPVSSSDHDDAHSLAWCRDTAYLDAKSGRYGDAAWASRLLSIRPAAQSMAARPVYDALLADWALNTSERLEDIERAIRARTGESMPDVLVRVLDARRLRERARH